MSHIQDSGDALTSPYGDALSTAGDAVPTVERCGHPTAGDVPFLLEMHIPPHEISHLPQKIEQHMREMWVHLQNPEYVTLLEYESSL